MNELMGQRDSRTGLTNLRRLAWLFDELIRIPGTHIRIGLDPLIGLIPGGGDLIGGAVSAYALLTAARLGAPASVVLRMGLNILIDTVVGAVPLFGLLLLRKFLTVGTPKTRNDKIKGRE